MALFLLAVSAAISNPWIEPQNNGRFLELTGLTADARETKEGLIFLPESKAAITLFPSLYQTPMQRSAALDLSREYSVVSLQGRQNDYLWNQRQDTLFRRHNDTSPVWKRLPFDKGLEYNFYRLKENNSFAIIPSYSLREIQNKKVNLSSFTGAVLLVQTAEEIQSEFWKSTMAPRYKLILAASAWKTGLERISEEIGAEHVFFENARSGYYLLYEREDSHTALKQWMQSHLQ